MKIYTEYFKTLKNIHLSVVTFINMKDYPLFLFENILQISVKKIEKNIFQSCSVHYLRRSSYKYRQQKFPHTVLR